MNEQQYPAETPPAPIEAAYSPTHATAPLTVPNHASAGYPQHLTVAPKNPAIALLASFFFPGLGSLMNGDVGKGIGIFAGYFVSWLMAFILIGIPFLFGFWIWGMVDAYGGAKKWNARHGIIS